MAHIIGIYAAKGGAFARFVAGLRRLVGSSSCDLMRITHGVTGEKKQWRVLQKNLRDELSHTHLCLYPSQATAVYQAASSGREPCVLLEDDEGTLSMILDWNDLSAAKGNVNTYEKILRSKLLMY